MPRTAPFPSDHAASASAFATGVATASPEAVIPLSAAATLGTAVSDTGVHHPVDVIGGTLSGATLAQLTAVALERAAADGPAVECHLP
jgi:membrane-associated phospholipid phosphatase